MFEEVWDDEVVLPMYEGRILGKVERIDWALLCRGDHDPALRSKSEDARRVPRAFGRAGSAFAAPPALRRGKPELLAAPATLTAGEAAACPGRPPGL